MNGKIDSVRKIIKRPITITEKILYSHIYDEEIKNIIRAGQSYVDFLPDRVAMQDATAQMASAVYDGW